jgi:iron complex outermembrane recepter protein
MIRTLAAALATSTCIMAIATPAAAQTRAYTIPAGSLKSALDAYVRQSGRQVVYRADEVRPARSRGARGQLSAEAALADLLAGSGFTTRPDGNLVAIVKEGNGSGRGENMSSSGRASRGEGEADFAGYDQDIVVTAQKKEERLKDVPVPVSILEPTALASTQQVQLRDYYVSVPGLNVNPQIVGGQGISIRGISTGGLLSPTVGLVIDDVPYGPTASF